MPTEHVSGICRFYLQEVSPNFRLYVTPINVDPTKPAVRISEPASFITDVSEHLGLFYTTGFQEDHKALSNGVFADDEFQRQATMVLEERLALLEYAVENYDDGLLFFYFSSSDLQSHMFWWDSDEKHPTRSGPQSAEVLRPRPAAVSAAGRGDRRHPRPLRRASRDHRDERPRLRQFRPPVQPQFLAARRRLPRPARMRLASCKTSTGRETSAYGLGINGLYLNLKGRERDGIVEPGEQREELLSCLIAGLQAVRDVDGRASDSRGLPLRRGLLGQRDRVGPRFDRRLRPRIPRLVGDLPGRADAGGIDWTTNRPGAPITVPMRWKCPACSSAIGPSAQKSPSLVDLAPTILAEFGLPTPSTMEGKNFFVS